MSELKQFTFFESYYKAIKKLSPEEAGEIVLAMGAYFFEDQEIPELDGITGAVLEVIRPNISNSKARATSGKKGGESKPEAKAKQTSSKRQAKSKQTESKGEAIKDKGLRIKDKGDLKKDSPTESGKKTASEIVKDRHLVPRLEEKVLEWVKYKAERKEYYKETGLNALITEIQNNVNDHDIDYVIRGINQSMANGYKGIYYNVSKQGNGDNRASPATNPKIHNFKEREMTDDYFSRLEQACARN